MCFGWGRWPGPPGAGSRFARWSPQARVVVSLRSSRSLVPMVFQVVQVATQYLGVPYRYGGATPAGDTGPTLRAH